MSGAAEIFLGITIVGLIMTVKVVMDGLKSVTQLNDNIATLRASTKESELLLEDQEKANAELERDMQEIKAEVDKLVEKEKEMDTNIKALRTDLDGHKTDA
ncbi:MAG: hypothetical protein ACO36I_04305 [Candidatus Latescibacterota bacterium]|jgi:septal ring factor EnvC (AmiA/AmiB activator)